VGVRSASRQSREKVVAYLDPSWCQTGREDLQPLVHLELP
jgi:hypothetical protein